ncbi:MAG: DsrE/DsrF/DrsH-like family protein [Lachnospiraceae bacterium]
MKICIVGGVAGGASAATRLRRLDEDAEIILFEKGEFISYANCGLPYYIGGIIKEEETLIVTKPELLRERFLIDVRVRNEVTAINKEEKKIQVKNHETGELYEESYDKLLLSPGAAPKIMFPEAAAIPGVFTLRTVPDTLKIRSFIDTQKPKTAVVIGGGFIGIEMAENLTAQGIAVTVVEFAPHIVASMDHELANILHTHLAENGVSLLLKTGVTNIKQEGSSICLSLTNDTSIHADLVLMSVGVAPESRLAKETGLSLGMGNSIAVTDTLQTSDSNIYAVGDAISIEHAITHKESLIPLAGPANRQGRIVAENILGASKSGNLTLGSAVLKVFDLTAASTGLSEAQCQKMNIDYKKTYVHPFSHASYYPGATQITMKLLFTNDGSILGAQAVGYEGVEKHIDVIASVIHFKGTVKDLEELELCYAPPFSSAKDPVNMLGFTASNILNGSMPVFYAEDLETLDLNKIQLIDVSTPDEVLMGTIKNSRNIPLDTLRNRMAELDPSKPVYLFCRIGLRGYIAARILLQHGYQVFNLSGGYKTYMMIQNKKTSFLSKECSHKEHSEQSSGTPAASMEVNACGLQCPGPIMKVADGMKELKDGEQLLIHATDPAFASDIKVWCERTGNQCLTITSEKGIFHVTLQKGTLIPVPSTGNDKTMVIFSGDLDKAIAAFIIANGSVAMGRKVTLFFTFWGLNILRKNSKVTVSKTVVEKMFGKLMPRGSKKLGLSRMNMGGMGAKMIRTIMKKKQVSSLEELIQSAIQSGVRIVACEMSMDLMGIHPEELIPGVELGGVATFLGSAETSDTNLFI